ncbi:MAG: glycosyltransferase family 39 protein [Tepidisphaeraceae bacterium]
MPADNRQPPEPQTSTLPWLSPRTAAWLTPVFLFVGVECWLVVGKGNYGHQHQPLLILAAVVCGFLPPIRQAFNWLWKALERPSPRTRLCLAIAIGLGSSLFLYWTQRFEKTPFHPKFHDEFSYLIQMRMLAHGRLWMPAIPCPDFFDTFYLFVSPVYASMYFPGAAMMYVPALLLHLPYFIAPLAASGLCAALLYLIFTDILDGASALLAVLILLSMGMFRMMSIMLMAQTPTLLLGLAMIWSVLHWRRGNQARWLVILGLAAGWAAITRPADALCFAIVLAIVMAMDLRPRPWQAWAKTAAWVIVPALPFLAIQLTLNRNVTGHWLTTPFARYTDLNYPGAIGFHQGSAPPHVSNVPEKQLFYELYAKGVIEQHQLKNLFAVELSGEWAAASTAAMPDAFFWLIVPMSILALWDRRLWAVWGMLPLYLLVLAGYSFAAVLPHYVVVVMPAMILLCLLPIRFLTDTFPKRAAMIRTMIGLGMIALTIAAMPQLNRVVHDQYFETPELEAIDWTLSREVSPPAVVMFHFNRDTLIRGRTVTDDPSIEPVFNSSVAWPDDAAIIRAHDLNPNVSAIGKPGDLDQPLYAYYARIDPKRVFYLYDRGGLTKLRRLGTAEELAQAARAFSGEHK